MNGRKKQFEENKGLFINYNLCDVEKLQLFINKYKDAIVGQELSAYRCYNDNGSGPEPLVLSFGKLSFIIQYYYFDELSIMVFDTEYLEKDPSLNILFRDIPESRNVCMFGPECLSYPFLGLTVEDISYKVIEEKYFNDIEFHFSGNKALSICPDSNWGRQGFMTIHRNEAQ